MNEGYLDAITNSYFKVRDDGTKLFYPRGAIGRLGYLVPSAELEERGCEQARNDFSSVRCSAVRCWEVASVNSQVVFRGCLWSFSLRCSR